jgi:anionic cell wall polymer biosynthesis LytR-Cps2A-Psr (LCP) family protein
VAFLAVWAVVAISVTWAWYEYGRLSHDLRVSNHHVGGPLRRALTPAAPGAPISTTLVAGVDSRNHVAGTVILARTNRHRRAVEFLTLPSSAQPAPGRSLAAVLRDAGLPAAIDLLRTGSGLPVAHVVLIRLGQAGRIVAALGGITISNPTPVDYDVPPHHGVFPAGRVALTGRTVRLYLDPTERPPGGGFPAGSDARQTAVVRGVADRLVDLTTPSRLTAAAGTVVSGITTDISPDPVLGLVAARLDASTLIDCVAAPDAVLAGGADPAVAGFRAAAARGGCTARPLHAAVPAANVAASIITAVVAHGGSSVLYWLVVATVAIWAVAALAWVVTAPAVRELRPRTPAFAAVAARVGGQRGAAPAPGRRRTRWRPSPDRVVLVVAIPVSVGLGILIARVLS